MLGLILFFIAALLWFWLVAAPDYVLSALLLCLMLPFLVLLSWAMLVGRAAKWLNRACQVLMNKCLAAEDRLYK